MKLSAYAKKMGVRYEPAWRWFKAGAIKGRQMATGTIIIDDPVASPPASASQVAIYARVSAVENRPNLDRQAERLEAYCAAKGYQIHHVVKEVGSGVNDHCPKFLKLLADTAITTIVVEHKDRATRFGFAYLETLLEQQDRRIEVVNLAEHGREDLVTDLVSMIYSFSARLYGQRRAKRTTTAIQALLASEDQDATGGTAPD